MSKYSDLRVYFQTNTDEKLHILRKEMLMSLRAARSITNNLYSIYYDNIGQVSQGRLDELLRVLMASIDRAYDRIGMVTLLIQERTRGGGNIDENDVNAVRHELIVPVSTIQSVASLLEATVAHSSENTYKDVIAQNRDLAEAAKELQDIVDTLTDPKEY